MALIAMAYLAGVIISAQYGGYLNEIMKKMKKRRLSTISAAKAWLSAAQRNHRRNIINVAKKLSAQYQAKNNNVGENQSISWRGSRSS